MSKQALIERLKGEIAAIESSASTPDAQVAKSSEHSSQREVKATGGRARKTADCKDAFSRIIALVNASDKSEKTIRERLAACDYEAVDIDEAVARAKEFGFIDDARYADLLIRSRISQGKGQVGIERELRNNGIDPSMIPDWPNGYELDYDVQFERAYGVLKRNPPHSKNKRDSAYRKLIQKGYPSSISSSVARVWAEEQEKGMG